ncbi:RHS domain-containing protein [Prevotella intermedia]|uniref:RHS domain-containing protein n=1 Tax=Prevotella intermedia TaxID=28131 RepID=UPI0027E34458|nr:RHS domain-containing protein [Prevotella intermedia]
MGRPVEAYNSYGTIVWQGDYDIYGNLRNRKGIRDFIPFRSWVSMRTTRRGCTITGSDTMIQ